MLPRRATSLTAPLAAILLAGPALGQSCPPDLAEPFGVLDGADQMELIARVNTADPAGDWDDSGSVDFFDVLAYLTDYDAGCGLDCEGPYFSRGPLTLNTPQYDSVKAVDLDSDGFDDYVLFGAVPITLYRSLGNDNFVPVWGAGISGAVDVEFADMNGDGKLDIISMERDPELSRLRVYLNDGDNMSFSGLPSLGFEDARDLVLEDVDQDGDIDAVLTGFQYLANISSGFATYLNNGNGSLAVSQQEIIFNGTDIAVGDLGLYWGTIADANGDSYPDLWLGGVVTNAVDPFKFSMGVSVWTNDGTGRFDRPSAAFASDQDLPIQYILPLTVIAADFTGDGSPDAALRANEGAIVLFENDQSGILTQYDVLQIAGLNAISSADVNRDGLPDLLAFGEVPGSDALMVAVSTGSGFLPIEINTLSDSLNIRSMGVGDFNGDGAPDVVGSAGNGPQVGGREQIMLGTCTK